MDWFELVFGFKERPMRIFKDAEVVGKDAQTAIIVRQTGKEHHVGKFDCISLKELRHQHCAGNGKPKLLFTHIVANVADIIGDAKNAGAVFQVASQFNCLEMANPYVTPAHGITCYEDDKTQGPACAMACPAATLYRNYFLGDSQLDMLCEMQQELKAYCGKTFWRLQNGYCLPNHSDSFQRLSHVLKHAPHHVKQALKVGVHWSTSVAARTHNVTQVLCSALPLTCVNQKHAKRFACLLLCAAYECTLAVAAILAKQRKCRITVYLTKLGGGTFGNKSKWIRKAIQKAVCKYRAEPLHVVLVHYQRMEREYATIN